MTPEQQRIAIAEACGWIYTPEHDVSFNTPAGKVFPESWRKETEDEDITCCEDGLPDYLNDLNAMHEAEKTMSNEDLWYMTAILAEVVGAETPIAHATAAQRAEAFLRTKGLWKD